MHVDTIGRLTHVDTPVRMRQELALQIPLGNTFIATKGWGAPEAQQTYTRATELCEQLGELSQLFPVLYGLCLNACLQGRLPTALEIGREFLRLAQSQDNSGPLLVAHRSLGLTLCWLGEFVEARAHFEQSLALFDPQQHHDLTFQYSVHPRVGALTFLAHTLWMLGYPDQAFQMSLEARAVAEQLTHPFSLAYAQVEAARHYKLRREPSVVQEVADTLVTLSTEQGFAQHLAQGMVRRGWARVSISWLKHLRQLTKAAAAITGRSCIGSKGNCS